MPLMPQAIERYLKSPLPLFIGCEPMNLPSDISDCNKTVFIDVLQDKLYHTGCEPVVQIPTILRNKVRLRQ